MKLGIIADEIHQLVRIGKNDEWTKYAWRIHEKDDKYWVPVPDEKRTYENKLKIPLFKKRRFL
jgi:hypothetical protein